MKEAFTYINFHRASRERIVVCNQIVEKYMAQGLRLTLRQLYYQLVSANVIPNKEREYKNLAKLVSDARLAGEMDWDAIEDRIREPSIQAEFVDLNHLVRTMTKIYRLPRWRDQPVYAELWCEKDALAGVLAPLAQEFHITLMVNRGYSSQSAMRESAARFATAHDDDGKRCLLFYLGDHDPSGEDMVRDIHERLVDTFGCTVEVRKLALTMRQVTRYALPPNPAKMTDPRAEGYVIQHGEKSWEVDALQPTALNQIVRTAFKGILDQRPTSSRARPRRARQNRSGQGAETDGLASGLETQKIGHLYSMEPTNGHRNSQ
jgi:hypothetical protein